MRLQSCRLRAIDAGNLILEIKRNFRTTCRVPDYGCKGRESRPRQLHLQQSLQSIDLSDFEPQPQPSFSDVGERIFAECPEFRIRQVNLEAGETLSLASGEQPRILSIVAGALQDLRCERRLRPADNALVPFVADSQLRAACASTVLITENFHNS